MAVGSRGPPSLILDHRWPGLEWLPTKDLHPRTLHLPRWPVSSFVPIQTSRTNRDYDCHASREKRAAESSIQISHGSPPLSFSLPLFIVFFRKGDDEAPLLSTDISVANLAGQLLIYMPSSPRWSSFPRFHRAHDSTTCPVCQPHGLRFVCDGIGLWSFGTYRFFDVRIGRIVVNRSIEILSPTLWM